MAADGDTPWIIAGASSLLGGGGVWGWLTNRAKLRQAREAAQRAEPADLATAYASFAKTLNDQAEAFIRTLQAEREALVRHINELRQQVDRLSAEHEECLGDNRDLRQRVESMERLLKTKSGSFVVLEDKSATVLTPAAQKGATP